MAMGWRRRAALPALGCLVVACSLNFDRYEPNGEAGSPLDGGLDASSADHAVEAPAADAPVNDVAPDTYVSPCKLVPGMLAAPEASGPITIDGDLGDWGAAEFTLLAASDAAFIEGPSGTCTAANATSQCLVPAGETAEYALLRDAANLYFAVRVTVPNVGGGSTTSPFTNDAVEIYLSGDTTPTGNYTSVDHQYVIDWANLVTDYGPSATDMGQVNPPGVTSAVNVATNLGSYVVEVKVALSALGLSALAPGQILGLDLGLDHGQGTEATRSFLVWWMATHTAPTCTTAKCTSCSPDQPYCDTLTFGQLCAD
jgi:hypothetical protein